MKIAGKNKENQVMSYLIPIMLVGVIVMMIVPVPSWILDVLLSFNISLALVILFVSLYVAKPLEFSSYPAIVLMTTLFRLGMNITSTRLILLHGDEGPDAAGHVIQAFGYYVLGGNYVVGVVVFAIIMLVNFTVITKGAGRIAEVAARFTLDAMPGKQMAIDSDLNAGLIKEDEAKRRRKELTMEAEFYGAMDGASKFVGGDAKAGIVIALINLLGGFFIGVFQKGMDWRDAASVYTILTVGDGLVAAIPALIISTSAGIIVARAASGADLGTELSGQLTKYKKPLILSSGVSLFFALIPGLPFLPFLLLSIGAAVVAATAGTNADDEVTLSKSTVTTQALPAGPAPGSTEEVQGLLGVDLLELEVGYELVPMVDVASGGDLIDRIRALRRQFALDLGFIVPAIHIRDNVRLEPNQYRLLLKGIEIAGGIVKPHHFLAMDPGGVEARIPGTPTKEPAFGLDAIWIAEGDKERAQFSGYTVVDPSTVITTHITEVIKNNAHEIIGRQEVQALLDSLSRNNPKLVEEVVPLVVPLSILQQVLAGLLREGISVRDLRTILETLADWIPTTKVPERLVEQVRRALGRAITAKYTSTEGLLSLVSMAPSVERALADSLQVTDQGSYLALDPATAQRLINKLKTLAERFAQTGATPLLLAPAALRPALYGFAERFIPGYAVLSHQEIAPSAKVQALGVVAFDE